ncbi:MAG: DMT family transporter [Spirochaetales bacterium]|nr:DMT family transporter [Spirochaetales bacterium]
MINPTEKPAFKSPETSSDTTESQKPLSPGSVIWVLTLVISWAINTILVKVVIRDIPPVSAAFIRFLPATIIMIVFLCLKKISLKVTWKELGLISILGVISALQIFTFNTGAQFTTGGRVTLFIYSYPFPVAFIAPLFIRGERFSTRVIIGCTIALAGMVITLYARLAGGQLKGDLIEILSAMILAFRVVVNKRLMLKMNRWKVLIYTLLVSTVLYLAGGLAFEKVDFSAVKWDAWTALILQILFTTCFTFLSWQYLLSRHSAAKLSAFFFACPVIGMIFGIILLGESFDPGLVAGCILVGAGILIVQLKKKKN